MTILDRSPLEAITPVPISTDHLVDRDRQDAVPARRPRYGRTLDLTLAVAALPFALVLGLVIALAVVLSSPGPALFWQWRVGPSGDRFRMAKFRSMQVGADRLLETDADLSSLHRAGDHKLTPSQDPRLTRLGVVLRSTSLDEIPQLWNVLRGEMSIVGPRPMVEDEYRAGYQTHAAEFAGLRAGMTGLWQVSGRSTIQGEERVALDRTYAASRSLSADLAILARTIPALITRRGAY